MTGDEDREEDVEANGGDAVTTTTTDGGPTTTDGGEPTTLEAVGTETAKDVDAGAEDIAVGDDVAVGVISRRARAAVVPMTTRWVRRMRMKTTKRRAFEDAVVNAPCDSTKRITNCSRITR